jgi:glucosamine-6-phosphate deaminase
MRLLAIGRERLGVGSAIRVVIAGDADSLIRRMAVDMADAIAAQNAVGEPTRLIVPVGPVGQYAILAEIVNRTRLSLRKTWFFNMDEYLTDDDQYLPFDHPLSFRRFMDRSFYQRLDADLAPPDEQRVFPDPCEPEAVTRKIDELGGIDVCFGGVGINGHVAFNEPPEPGENLTLEQFAALPTRVLTLSRETRTINSVTVGGDIAVIPRRAVTIGMREILSARSVRLYCNRPWQSGVVRRVVHGPITPQVPASLLQRHGDAVITIADFLADPPEIMLR